MDKKTLGMVATAAMTPDIIIDRPGEYRYECYCDRSKEDATSELPLEQQPIWRIMRISITETEADVVEYRNEYPNGSRNFDFKVSEKGTYTYNFAK